MRGTENTKWRVIRVTRTEFLESPKTKTMEAAFHHVASPSPTLIFRISSHIHFGHIWPILEGGCNMPARYKCHIREMFSSLPPSLPLLTPPETPVINHFAMEATTPHLSLEVKAFRRGKIFILKQFVQLEAGTRPGKI
jgi:hypothetical protein